MKTVHSRAPASGAPESALWKLQERHWKEQPEGFASLYKKADFFHPAGIVSAFLDARTAMLESLMDCHPRDRVLDVGCGSGVHMIRLLSRCQHVAGIDYSEGMVSLARQALEAAQQKNWELHCGDAMRLPFDDASFDWIISLGLLDYVPSARQVLHECKRVLRPGGRVIFTIPKSPSLFSPLRTAAGNAVKRYVFRLPPVGNVMTRMALENLVQQAGLRLQFLQSIWTAMWVVKAVDFRSAPQ